MQHTVLNTVALDRHLAHLGHFGEPEATPKKVLSAHDSETNKIIENQQESHMSNSIKLRTKTNLQANCHHETVTLFQFQMIILRHQFKMTCSFGIIDLSRRKIYITLQQ